MTVGARPARDAGIGAVAGVAGGVVFGVAMGLVGTLPSVAQIVRSDSPAVGFVLHMAIASFLGAGFGVLVSHQRVRVGETLLWGLLYGVFWWFLGAQTLLPILAGRALAWDLAGAGRVFPSLIGHLFYGGVTAVVFVALRRGAVAPPRPRLGTLARGAAAGVIAAGVLYLVADVMAGAELNRLAVIGVLVGAGYPALFGTGSERSGPALIRGAVYGFLIWVLDLTLLPVLDGGSPSWSRDAAAASVPDLPPSVLLGAGVAVVFGWLGGLSRLLFADDVRAVHREAPGGWGLRALGHGALAGLAGGVLFTAVLAAVGALPRVAQIMGSAATGTGLVLNLLIALVIGVSYAVLFRRCSFDVISGIGWGACYGFFWWMLGPLTLLPALTGATPRFDPATIAVNFPALVGHLAYGAALGGTYYLLEARANPWWLTRNQAESERVLALRDQTLGSAPALWGLTVLIALTVPLLVTS